MKNKIKYLFLFLLFTASGFSAGGPFNPIETILVWNPSALKEDSVDQLSFQNTFAGIGLSPSRIPIPDFRKKVLNSNMLILLPHASASFLRDNDIDKLLNAVNSGARLITDGRSSLADLLKIKFSSPASVKFVKDSLYPKFLLHWADAPKVPLILNAPDKTFRAIFTEPASGHSLGILKNYGKGMILYLSPLFDPVSGEGYSRFPNLPNLVIKEMNCAPLFKRRGVDAYFDPGYRWDFPIRKLVSIWKSWGIKAVHAAAWNIYDASPYNYKQLISEAHKQGILVYAWLEWPYVGKGFWDAHPEWREKDANLKDAQLDFLSLMDLQNPACMKQAMDDLSALLKDDWDGIDIAEFSITGGVAGALDGPSAPTYFTGFNDIARQEFKSIYGFDQADLFNPSSQHFWKKDTVGLNKFYKYRVKVNNRLLEQIVTALDSLKAFDNRDWELIFTVLDNSLHPEFDQLLGFDLKNTIRLAKEYHVTLQVEDPQSEWTRPPSRYDQLAKAYTPLLGDVPLAIDINIVPVHPKDQKGYASEQPTGTELFRQYSVADNACGRVCFYSESTIYPYDWEVFPYVMASGIVIRDNREWNIQTPHTVTMPNPVKHERIFLDYSLYPCFSKDEIIIPKGKHYLAFIDTAIIYENKNTKNLRLTGISGEIISCRQYGEGIELLYESPARCLITLSKLPATVRVDGRIASLKIIKENNSFILFAPTGKHTLMLDAY